MDGRPMVMRIYPCTGGRIFILFLMYAAILFLYYYIYLKGSVDDTQLLWRDLSGSVCSLQFVGDLVWTWRAALAPLAGWTVGRI